MNARIALCLAALGLVGMGSQARHWPRARASSSCRNLPALAKKASESVKVTFDAQLLRFAARFLNSKDPEEAAAQQLCASLTGIYVRKFTFDSDYTYPTGRNRGRAAAAAAPGWSQLVEARSNKENTRSTSTC